MLEARRAVAGSTSAKWPGPSASGPAVAGRSRRACRRGPDLHGSSAIGTSSSAGDWVLASRTGCSDTWSGSASCQRSIQSSCSLDTLTPYRASLFSFWHRSGGTTTRSAPTAFAAGSVRSCAIAAERSSSLWKRRRHDVQLQIDYSRHE